MTAPLLLELLEHRGARIERRGNRLTIDAPRGALCDLAPELAKFKPALLELLDCTATAPLATNSDGASLEPLDFDAKAAYWRLPAKRRGLSRAAQVERARTSLEGRFAEMLERADEREGRSGNGRDVWALCVAIALLDAGKLPE